jgi:hypothetical protein
LHVATIAVQRRPGSLVPAARYVAGRRRRPSTDEGSLGTGWG